MSTYSKKYLKTFTWKGVEMLLRFASMFIVVPLLTSDPSIYGIYVVCMSVNIFLSYADLGFIGAGQKYAAEYYAQGNRKLEIQSLGFASFILLVFTLLITIVFFVISYNPNLLIKDLSDALEINVASKLLLILAVFSPMVVLKRLLSMIFSIRIEEYTLRVLGIVPTIIGILSVYWFFREGHNDIVGYYLFGQILSLIPTIIGLVIIKRRYNYDFSLLLKSTRFNKKMFDKTNKLAFSGLFATISWIIYYELDSIAIGKVLGATQVAFFGIGLSFLNFFRNLLGVFFSPFLVRFNHFIGADDKDGLRSIFMQVVVISVPITVLPMLSLFLIAEPIVLSWVGKEYMASVNVAKILVLLNIFAFISYPGGMLLYSKEKFKQIYILGIINPVVFWFGVLLTYKNWGIESFAFFKFFSFLLAAVIYTKYSLRLLDISFLRFFKQAISPIIIPLVFTLLASFFVRDYLPMEKGKINLLIVGLSIATILMLSMLILMIVSKKTRLLYKEIFKSIK